MRANASNALPLQDFKDMVREQALILRLDGPAAIRAIPELLEGVDADAIAATLDTMRQVVLGPGGAVVSETAEYRDVGRGFYAEPRVRGDRVSVDISQQSDAPGRRGDASIQVQRLSTTVSGRLGEWLQLGGTGQDASSRRQGTLSLSTSEVRESRGIWLMVEELP